MRRLRIALATGAIAVTMAQVASAADPATTTTTTAETPTPPAGTPPPPPTGVTVTPTPVPPAPTTPSPPKPGGQGGKPGSSGSGGNHQGGSKQSGHKGDGKGNANGKQGATNDTTGGAAVPPSGSAFGSLALSGLAPTSCTTGASAPLYLLPIYQQASDAYGLGPQGPGVLAAINGIESGFGANLGPSSAGAVGWMQFMPSTWATYGVDANGDGKADPNDPQDAIFSAARYLQAAGMPVDTPGAIFAYNHADWYVAEVLANAGCYGGSVGTFGLTSGIQQMTCKPAPNVKVPLYYMQAFEDAAGRFDLGERGVWALAAVARLESDFGHSMTPEQILRSGPLGLDRDEWNRFEIDGDGDGRIEHVSVGDSAATLAREIWSRGSLQAGLFLHNQAEWYVQQVLDQADQIAGHCSTQTADWSVALPAATSAPINWTNLTLSNGLELRDIQAGAVDPRIMGLLGMITQSHKVTITALRSDHSEFTSEGNVSNHFFGRAMDIGAVDGVSCTDTAPNAPCGELGRTLAQLTGPMYPTELIYCFDLDGPGPAFARSDHCDHVHVGFDG
ncbi:MAG: lytic transglycosylase domain-containing protein [Actinomycetota bacterium]